MVIETRSSLRCPPPEYAAKGEAHNNPFFFSARARRIDAARGSRLGPIGAGLCALALAACGAEELELGRSTATLIDDQNHDADRHCQVVLAEASRENMASGEIAYNGAIQTAADATARGARAALLFGFVRDATDRDSVPWRVYVPFRQSDTHTPFRMDESFLNAGAQARADQGALLLIPFLIEPDGTRLFDHNRIDDDFGHYALEPSNGFRIEPDPDVCPVLPRVATPRIIFDEHGVRTEGALVAGGEVTVEYPLERLDDCRQTDEGRPIWDLEAHLRFSPSRSEARAHPVQFSGNRAEAVPQTVRIPSDSDALELWFRNWGGHGESCQSWDSNGGDNYVFPVLRPPAWVGLAGVELGPNADCDRAEATPLEGGFDFDTAAREQGAEALACFQVYRRGATDGSANALARELDGHVFFRYGGFGRWNQAPLAPAHAEANNGRFAFDFSALDPFRDGDCAASLPVEPQQDGRLRLRFEFYFSVNGRLLTSDGRAFGADFWARPDPAGQCF